MVAETFPVGFKVFYVVDFGHGELGFFELVFLGEELLFIDLFFWGYSDHPVRDLRRWDGPS